MEIQKGLVKDQGYADVTCTYKMSSDDTLNKYSSKILYFGPTILITTYKKEFTIAS